MEQVIVQDIRVSRSEVRISVAGMPEDAATLAALLGILGDLGIRPGILGRRPGPGSGGTDVVFTVPRSSATRVAAALMAARRDFGGGAISVDDRVARVTLSGLGLRGGPVVPRLCEALARAGVLLDLVSTGSGQVSVVCPVDRLAGALSELAAAFEVTPTAANPGLPLAR